MKKLHIVNTVYGSARGGRWQVLVDYSRWLIEEGHKVTVIIDPRAKESTKEILEMGCHLVELKSSGFYDFIAKTKSYFIIKRLSPDAILSHGGRSTYLFQFIKNKKTPLIAINHSNNIKRTLIADIFFNISDHITSLVKSKKCNSITYRVINCPRHIKTGKSKAQINPSEIVISYMGQLIDRKGINILILAIEKLTKKSIKVSCNIAGTGPEEEKLKKLAKDLNLSDRINFIGFHSDPIEFISNSDIFCFPTLSEGFPISPIEAFAAGTAVIGTDDPGTQELLENGHLGLIAKRGDVNDLAIKLETLITDQSLRLELAKRAQLRYQERYTPANAKNKFINNLYDAIEKHAMQSDN